ncbi:MAG: DUF1275 domain-containing protein [Solirubrobacterales bacterium]|nr:DUF1275 domain-containing protein [Solirubrobacterales bacterium]
MLAEEEQQLRRDLRQPGALLVLMALGAGAVDALSLTVLDVFTAAITANIVLLGIAIGDGDPHTALRSALAVGGFALGVGITARLTAVGRPRPLSVAAALGAILAVQAAFLAVWVVVDGRPSGALLDLLAFVSAVAMGGETAAAARWKAGIPPTYVTGVLTAALSDLVTPGRPRRDRALRLTVVATVAVGAIAGTLALDQLRPAAAALPLAITALAILAARTARPAERPAG